MGEAIADGVDLIAYTWWGHRPGLRRTGEMRKRYGFIHVDKYDDGTGTYERRRKDSSSHTRRSSSPMAPRVWLNRQYEYPWGKALGWARDSSPHLSI